MGEVWPFYALFFGLFVLLAGFTLRKRLRAAVVRQAGKPESPSKMGDILYCSFCDKNQNEVSKLIAGPTVFICDECVELCLDIIHDPEKTLNVPSSAVTPAGIQAGLRVRPAGYPRAKMIVSLALFEQIKRDAKVAEDISALSGNGHILLVGPFGSGKRLLAYRLALLRGGPIACSSASALFDPDIGEQGWQNLFAELLRSADFDADRASRGMVYIEDVDHLLQDDHLRLGIDRLRLCLRGTTLAFQAADLFLPPDYGTFVWDTRQTLFILGGAFHGLPDQCAPIAPEEAERLGRAVSLVEARKRAAGLQSVSRDALVAQGLDEELVERLPYVAVLRDRRDGEVAET